MDSFFCESDWIGILSGCLGRYFRQVYGEGVMGKRMNIALYVGMLENEFSYAVCEGAFLGAKELDANQKKKNINKINKFNEKLYHTVCERIEEGKIPLIIGGDHSIAIASCLASKKHNDNIGLVWFDAHADFNTFETTITGNIHGLPFACITGQNGNELSQFFDGNFFDPKKCVLVGARSIDYPGEVNNLKKAGIHIFTTEDIQNLGVKKVFDEAIKIVTDGTEGFHFSIDTDVMEPKEAPGVSVPEENGISAQSFLEMIQLFLNEKENIKSMDLVEYNPSYDKNHQTLKIIQNAMMMIINSFENKSKEE